ncbi:uncharacterized protein LACBIDRAFT_297554 [Laccaria bicolor S238N-H82]|uniref:Predicted protein n=1 Tax=Laccaria bicolor (strain S238N-H82 / ATCC MYA-4686) TaxID=486041 RepID=B0DBG1_LACBS|nr:uncharacterized protein LACBIDRAFT_297554 [Laccaria bicolor S238N-H82]EDR07989.1 predicted protein [Laccaria bicolor S238N-H82]|eukprot:XP_001881059.1 predicted protein [Laccaria bicolor S238N-H82]
MSQLYQLIAPGRTGTWRAMRTYQPLSKTTSETTHIDYIIPLLRIDFQINAVRMEPNVVGMRNGFIFSQ